MSAKKEVALTLSKEDIVKEGIEIKLTQSDVIEMLVEEQVNTITETIEKLNQKAQVLFDETKLEWETYIDGLLASVPVPKGLIVTGRYFTNTSVTGNNQIFDIREGYVSNGNIKYVCNYKSCTTSAKGVITINYQGTISGIELKGHVSGPDYDFTHSKKLVAAIEKHNKEVKDFLALMPEKGINWKEIARKIKNQFTKEILKTSSADFRKKLKEGFGFNS